MACSARFCAWIANRAILYPTQGPVDPEGKLRRRISSPAGEVEVFIGKQGESASRTLFVLKLIGAGGRAERATLHPLDFWGDSGEVWTLNPPGFGDSAGQATLSGLLPSALAVYDAIAQEAAGKPILITGNSLGCATALAIAARRQPAGLLLRNPPPLREVIWTRFGLRTLGLATLAICGVPKELNSLENANNARAPALFVSSQRDRVVPPNLQDRIFSAYRGPRHLVRLLTADHHETAQTKAETEDYATGLEWLKEQVMGDQPD